MKPIALVFLLVIVSCAPQPSAVPPAAQTSAAPTASPSPSTVLDVPAERSTLKTYVIAPKDTDASIEAPLDPHFVAVDPGVPSRGQLFLFIRRAMGPPADAQLIVRQAAANGFHAIGLAYAARALGPLCSTNADASCFEKVRLETVDGEDRTPLVTVTRANSILNRLTKLIAHLASRSPSEGWSAYLDGDTPRWSKIRLGGHSLGGGYAALIARDKEVARACLLEGPVDLIGAPGAAGSRLPPWIVAAGATPADRYYGIRHARSSEPNVVAFAQALAVFGVDRFGPPVATDTASPPYGGSHHLTTEAAPVDDRQPNLSHRSLGQDSVLAKTTSGQPVLAPVWQYACFS